MTKLQVIAALLGVVVLGACKAPEVTGRMDTGDLYTISATRDVREPSQSLAIVAMKDSLQPGQEITFTPNTIRLIREYGN